MELPPTHQTLIQNNDIQKRLSQLRIAFDRYRLEKLKDNKTADSSADLQKALFQAAKVGNVKLMMEFISHGANPFAQDDNNCDAISYAMEVDPIKTGNMLLELIKGTMQSHEGGKSAQ